MPASTPNPSPSWRPIRRWRLRSMAVFAAAALGGAAALAGAAATPATASATTPNPSPAPQCASGTCTVRFTTPGGYQWTVPSGVLSATVAVSGAEGGGVCDQPGGGLGGFARGTFDVSVGQTVGVVVGAEGSSSACGAPTPGNGGGLGQALPFAGGDGGAGSTGFEGGGGGGGGSFVASTNVGIVAGGGGGTGGYAGTDDFLTGGVGGLGSGSGSGLSGGSGAGDSSSIGGGGGSGGDTESPAGSIGQAGSPYGNGGGSGGGGGGGGFGGGFGGGGGIGGGPGGGGGGGGGVETQATSIRTAVGVNEGNGVVSISYADPTTTTTTTSTTTSPTVPVPQPPSISTDSASFTAGQAGSVQIQASAPSGEALEYQIGGAPSWVSIGYTTGELTGTPPASANGTYTFQVYVNDSQATAAETFELSVEHAPEVRGWRTLGWADGQHKTVTWYVGSTPSADVSVSGKLPAGITVRSGNGRVVAWGAPWTAKGTYRLVITATNPLGTATWPVELVAHR